MINETLKTTLLHLKEVDQQRAEAFNKSQINKVFIENSNRLKEIIGEYGWPTNSLVGKEASEAAWLIAQHSDHDLDFQKTCLNLMTIALSTGEVEKHLIAYLTDRILINEGKKQIFATQIKRENNKPVPYPTDDFEHVEERRANFNLPPLSMYLDLLS